MTSVFGGPVATPLSTASQKQLERMEKQKQRELERLEREIRKEQERQAKREERERKELEKKLRREQLEKEKEQKREEERLRREEKRKKVEEERKRKDEERRKKELETEGGAEGAQSDEDLQFLFYQAAGSYQTKDRTSKCRDFETRYPSSSYIPVRKGFPTFFHKKECGDGSKSPALTR